MISSVEEANTQAILRIQVLEKEMQSMAEHIDDLEGAGKIYRSLDYLKVWKVLDQPLLLKHGCLTKAG